MSARGAAERLLRWALLLLVGWVLLLVAYRVSVGRPAVALGELVLVIVLVRTGVIFVAVVVAARWANQTREPVTDEENEAELFAQFKELRNLPVAHGDPDDEL